MVAKLKRNTLGYNAGCHNCGKTQDRLKAQPLIIWYKEDNEKRGHNLPICSQECASKVLYELTKKSMGY